MRDLHMHLQLWILGKTLDVRKSFCSLLSLFYDESGAYEANVG